MMFSGFQLQSYVPKGTKCQMKSDKKRESEKNSEQEWNDNDVKLRRSEILY